MTISSWMDKVIFLSDLVVQTDKISELVKIFMDNDIYEGFGGDDSDPASVDSLVYKFDNDCIKFIKAIKTIECMTFIGTLEASKKFIRNNPTPVLAKDEVAPFLEELDGLIENGGYLETRKLLNGIGVCIMMDSLTIDVADKFLTDNRSAVAKLMRDDSSAEAFSDIKRLRHLIRLAEVASNTEDFEGDVFEQSSGTIKH